MASITFYVPDQEPVEVALDELEQLSIGRGPDNDMVLDHVSLSGSHAVIRNLGGAFQVNDLESIDEEDEEDLYYFEDDEYLEEEEE